MYHPLFDRAFVRSNRELIEFQNFSKGNQIKLFALPHSAHKTQGLVFRITVRNICAPHQSAILPREERRDTILREPRYVTEDVAGVLHNDAPLLGPTLRIEPGSHRELEDVALASTSTGGGAGTSSVRRALAIDHQLFIRASVRDHRAPKSLEVN